MSNRNERSWIIPNNVMPLPRTVPLRDHESAESILWRLAVVNGSRSVNRLFAATPNLLYSRDYSQAARCRNLPLAARLAGINESVLSQQCLKRVGPYTTFKNQSFRNLLAISRDRVCLGCLRDDQDKLDGPEGVRPYRRSWWGLQQISTCPVHRLRLLDSCPHCLSRFPPLTSPVRCSCSPHYDLRRLAQAALTEEQVAHDKWLLGRLGIGPIIAQSALDDLSPDVGSRLCLLIGLSAIYPDKIAIGGITSDQVCMAHTAGWSILDDWPHNLNKHLDRLVDSAPKYFYGGKGGCYEPLNGYLIRIAKRDNIDIVSDVIRAHASRNLPVTTRTYILGKSVDYGNLCTLEAIVRKVRFGYPTTLAVCRALNVELDGVNPRSSLVCRNDAKRIIKYTKECVLRSQLATTLRFPRRIIKQLLDNDVFRVRLCMQNDVLLWRKEIDHLKSLFSLPVRPANENEASTSIVLRALPFDWSTLVKAVIDRILLPVGMSKKDGRWSDFIFNFEEANSVSYLISGKVTKSSILKNYEWAHGTINFLRKERFITDCGSRFWIDPRVIEEFLSSHISMGEIVRRSGRGQRPSALRAQLNKLGIKSVIPSAEHITAFWRRDAVESSLKFVA